MQNAVHQVVNNEISKENNYIKEDGEKKKITADELKERIEAYEFKESGD